MFKTRLKLMKFVMPSDNERVALIPFASLGLNNIEASNRRPVWNTVLSLRRMENCRKRIFETFISLQLNSSCVYHLAAFIPLFTSNDKWNGRDLSNILTLKTIEALQLAMKWTRTKAKLKNRFQFFFIHYLARLWISRRHRLVKCGNE